ncbi:MAG TPA: hypothetical protein VFV63_06005 [Ilumatobacteraceae bacterium]|nr:hypothetical protein [Ilumatobacteraceae bacterium]
MAVALDVGRRSHIALVGGGDKTTLLHALGDQLRGRVVLTTTTRMGADQHDGRRVLLDPTDDEVVAAADTAPVVVWTRVDGGKAIGVDPARCDAWFAATDHVVVRLTALAVGLVDALRVLGPAVRVLAIAALTADR